jgi:hypothetical protein
MIPDVEQTKRGHICAWDSAPSKKTLTRAAERPNIPSVCSPLLIPRVERFCHGTRDPDHNVRLTSSKAQEWECTCKRSWKEKRKRKGSGGYGRCWASLLDVGWCGERDSPTAVSNGVSTGHRTSPVNLYPAFSRYVGGVD